MSTIRKAVAEDIEEIAQIYRDSYLQATHLNNRGLDFLVPELQKELGEKEFRVAEVDGKIAGVAIYYLYQGYDGITAYVQYLAVSERFRRNGVAASLMEKVESECQGLKVKRILLDVNKKALEARALYEREGYKENGMIQMEKEL